MFDRLDNLNPVLPSPEEIFRGLGYPDLQRAGYRMRQIAEEMLASAGALIEPWVGLKRIEPARIGPETIDFREGIRFHSPNLAGLLHGCRWVILGVLTIGGALEREVGRLQTSDQMVRALVLDAIGSAAVEALARQVDQRLCGRWEPEGLYVTRHNSPGYAGWDLDEQRLFFELLERCQVRTPVRLNEHAMMLPRKSLSAIWGLSPEPLGKERSGGQDKCRSCDMAHCPRRLARYESGSH